MGAVAVVVHRARVVVGKVPAVNVVDEPVAVVVDPVAGYLAWVPPSVQGEIRVAVVHAGVDHGDDHVSGSCGRVPGFGGVDVGIDDTARLADVVEAPELPQRRIVGGERGRDDEVGLDVPHARRSGRPAEHVLGRCAGGREGIETFTHRAGLPLGCQIPAGHGRRRGCPHDPGIRLCCDCLAVPFDLPYCGVAGIRRQGQAGFEQFHEIRCRTGLAGSRCMRPATTWLATTWLGKSRQTRKKWRKATGQGKGAIHGRCLPC